MRERNACCARPTRTRSRFHELNKRHKRRPLRLGFLLDEPNGHRRAPTFVDRKLARTHAQRNFDLGTETGCYYWSIYKIVELNKFKVFFCCLECIIPILPKKPVPTLFFINKSVKFFCTYRQKSILSLFFCFIRNHQMTLTDFQWHYFLNNNYLYLTKPTKLQNMYLQFNDKNMKTPLGPFLSNFIH